MEGNVSKRVQEVSALLGFGHRAGGEARASCLDQAIDEPFPRALQFSGVGRKPVFPNCKIEGEHVLDHGSGSGDEEGEGKRVLW